MASNQAPIVDRIRIIPRPTDFLDRNVGASGEVFFSKESNSLRVYSGRDISGFELARADLTNVNITNDNINWIPYAELTDLPSATDNHGMFAHVHATGKAYYAHAGNWIELANVDELNQSSGGASVDVSDTVPTEPTSGNLWLDTNTGKLYIYIDDGDSSQWIQPDTSVFSGNYNDLLNKPVYATVATTGSYNDLADKPTFGESGFDGTFNSLTGTPTTLAGYGITDAATSSQGALADTAVQPTSAIFTGLVTLQQTSETLNTLTGATGTIVHNLNNGAVFYHSSIASNFTANITNVPTTDDRTISVVLVLEQGGTPYIPNAIEVDGGTENINWQDATQPTGNANQYDIVSFTLIRTGAAWRVIGSLSTYG